MMVVSLLIRDLNTFLDQKTLIFDLDQTLAHIVKFPMQKMDLEYEITSKKGRQIKVGIDSFPSLIFVVWRRHQASCHRNTKVVNKIF